MDVGFSFFIKQDVNLVDSANAAGCMVYIIYDKMKTIQFKAYSV